jgi:hypothetical protein
LCGWAGSRWAIVLVKRRMVLSSSIREKDREMRSRCQKMRAL